MPPGPSRADALRPDSLLNFMRELVVENRITDEVCIRRAISALYFSLFNFWAAKRYDQGVRRKGPKQDRFDYREFHEELLGKGLDAELVLLYTYRVAADHYTLNPTVIRVYGDEMVARLPRQLSVRIGIKILENAIEAAEEILKNI